MESSNPFSSDVLNEIFKISSSSPNRVTSRESSTLEFKESFGWGNLTKYLRTCAAFANTKGGYIVFGVKDNPHLLKGLIGKSLANFEAIDAEQLTNHFNEYFSPEVGWNLHQYEINDRAFGLIYINECLNKPVMCRKNGGEELKEGDIYYRYRGRTERIKYPELKEILETERANEQKLWMKHFATIGRIGVREAAIFDLQAGMVEGAGGSVLIDENLLSQLSFIKEGEFSETHGKPTLKLIGNVKAITAVPVNAGRRTVVKQKGIRTADIVLDFLDQNPISDPEDYIKQICFESTAFLPIYYYMNQLGANAEDTVSIIDEVVSRSPSKAKLIERISIGHTQFRRLSIQESAMSIAKQKFVKDIKAHKIDSEINGKDLEMCIQAIRGLDWSETRKHFNYLCSLTRHWFNKYYSSMHGPIADNLRRAICWIDEAMYMEI